MSDQPEPKGKTPTPSPEELAAARFEFDKQVEDRRSQLEARQLRQARFDTWSRLVGTVVVGLLITGGIQAYGIQSEREANARAESAQQAQKEREESTQKAQVAIQLANAREKALSDLRAGMFNALLQNYFKEATFQERIAILALIGLNFRDSVQIKPMFEVLDAQLRAKAPTPETAQLRAALRNAAGHIIRDQLNEVQFATDGIVCRMKLKVGETASPDCFPQLAIELRKLDRSSIEVRTNSKDGELLAEAERDASGEREERDTFVVTYFDMPMVDYKTVLSSRGGGRWRYSVVLYETVEKDRVADIAVAILPIDAVGAQHRYAFDELLKAYLTPPPAAAPQGTSGESGSASRRFWDWRRWLPAASEK